MLWYLKDDITWFAILTKSKRFRVLFEITKIFKWREFVRHPVYKYKKTVYAIHFNLHASRLLDSILIDIATVIAEKMGDEIFYMDM